MHTDHAALTRLINFKEPEVMLAAWLLVLETFDFSIEHRPEKQHCNADGLCRMLVGKCFNSDCSDVCRLVREDKSAGAIVTVKPEDVLLVEPQSGTDGKM